MSFKGKEVATGGSSGKRKSGGSAEEDKPGGSHRKRKNREVLQFFEDAADIDEDEYESDNCDFDEEEFDIELKVKKEPVRTPNDPFIPKEEVMDEEEFDKMMEERYKDGSRFVNYAEDAYEAKSMERNSLFPSTRDPTIWKVKCMVGRERHSAFCLMQKFVDLKSLGTKLQIISVFAVDHVKGFIYIEADKQCDINEACKGLCSIYSTRVATVPTNEVAHLLSVRGKSNVVSEGMWARIKNGKYKGDLAQVVAVNDARKRATVKLIPRIDLQAMAQKFGGGVSMKNAAVPAPRLISSSELEEFRPLVQYRRDRDTGKMFEVLDGLLLKDGYLYKKVSVDSLSCWGVMPSEEELLKFQPAENNNSDNSEWLKQLYGTPKKKRVIGNEKGGEKGESSSGSGGFGLYDLVCFGRKDFGLIVGMEKGDYYKILKDGPEAPIVVSIGQHELKNGPSDMKFTALDHNTKTISINDTVRVLEGPLKDRQGIVKQIYRGVVFIYDQNDTENNGGYFCSKAQMCEKVKLSFDDCCEKDGEGTLGFEDFPSSPKSPLSPKRPWQTRESNRDFNQGDKDGMFSIGQTLRIRVGPLKGYLCRVLAIRYSDVTVKLDSQQKVLTVKREHLSEVRGKSSTMPASEDPGSNNFKLDLLGTGGGSTGWTNGAGTSADGGGWNTGVVPTEGSSWPSFKLQPESSLANSSGSAVDASWERKVTSDQNSSWGVVAVDGKAAANNDEAQGWGKSEDCWNKPATNIGSNGADSVGWGQAKFDSGNSTTDAAAAWNKPKTVIGNPTSSWGDVASGKNKLGAWGGGKDVAESGSWEKSKSSAPGEDNLNRGTEWNQQKSQSKESAWGSIAEARKEDTVQGDPWGKVTTNWDKKNSSSGSKSEWKSSTPAAEMPTEDCGNAGGSWAQKESENNDEASGWKKAKVDGKKEGGSAWSKQGGGSSSNKPEESTWGKLEGGFTWNKQDGGSSWNKPEESSRSEQERGSTWSKQGGGSWNKPEESNWAKQEGGSSWNKPEDSTRGKLEGGSTWSKKDGGSSWNKPEESSWGKQEGGSTCSKQGGGSWNKQEESTWGKQEGGSSWSKQDGGSSWNKHEGGESFNKQDRSQDFGGWNKSFDGGRGSGGRRGRGGGRGGIDQFGSGRSGGWSSGWNRGGEQNNWSGDEISTRNPPAWSNDQGGSWGKSREEVQKKTDSSWGDNGAGWNRSHGADKEGGESGDKPSSDKKSSWGNDHGECQDRDKGFAANQSAGGNWSSDWTRGSKTNMGKASAGDSSAGWTSGTTGEGGAEQSNWGAPKASNSSSWGNKDGNVDANQPSGWGSKNDGKSLDGGSTKGWGQSASWGSGSNDTDKNNDSDWGKKSGWNSGLGDSGGNGGSSWGRKSTWNSGSNDADGNQDSGWGKKSSWNSGSNDADGDQNSGWGKTSNWNSGSSDVNVNQDSGWGKKGNWNSGSADASQDSSGWGKKSSWNSGDNGDQTESRADGGNWRGGYGGRGGSDRGGFRGRGERGGFGGRNGSDRGGYGGRCRSDRGGFGGRGGSDRGGFRGRGDRGGYGGRGGGRRDYGGGGWNDNNDSGGDKAFDWKSGANNNSGGWKSSNGGSWNQGGADKDKEQLQSWNSGNSGAKNQAGGWSSQGSSWNQSNQEEKVSEDSGGGWKKEPGSSQGGGWKKESGSSSEGGGWNKEQSSGAQGGGGAWNKEQGSSAEGGGGGSGGGGWNKETGSTGGGGWNKEQVSGWSKGAGLGDAVTNGDQAKTWNESSGDQSSGWNQLKEGSNVGGESTDSWGKASASSWGANKGDSGSSKGGW
ncbi:hypothetical protein JCGZ_16173 [Jatropha curcas]|uniref:KOW domain-containing protein n=1 Tax=Jatropha curcas TaxID=180498 RepID=A0A067KF58_JATCU|nr:protein RNA-directed DNA methylation 3 [Jatropha curcas]KDP30494.1 hypothetical protein JCGZ_16173 [Jatropha curcas]